MPLSTVDQSYVMLVTQTNTETIAWGKQRQHVLRIKPNIISGQLVKGACFFGFCSDK